MTRLKLGGSRGGINDRMVLLIPFHQVPVAIVLVPWSLRVSF